MNRYSDIPYTPKDGNDPSDFFTLDGQTAAQLAEIFGALSDPSRIRIISVLDSGERNVRAIAQKVGISDSAVSHHLRGLRLMRLVRARKEGREVYYSLDDEHIRELYHLGLDHILHE